MFSQSMLRIGLRLPSQCTHEVLSHLIRTDFLHIHASSSTMQRQITGEKAAKDFDQGAA